MCLPLVVGRQMKQCSDYKLDLKVIFGQKVGSDIAKHVLAPYCPEPDESEARVGELVVEYMLDCGKIDSKEGLTVEVELRDDVIYEVVVTDKDDYSYNYWLFLSYKEEEAIKWRQDIWNDIDAFECMKLWAQRNNYVWEQDSEFYGDYLIRLTKAYAEVVDSLEENFPDHDIIYDSYYDDTCYVICEL